MATDTPFPWEHEGDPDMSGISLGERLHPLSLSGRHIEEEHYESFFAGQFLASLHGDGYRYVDFHRQNYGRIPIGGGLVIFDNGGMKPCVLDPILMAGDFLVPSLDRSDSELKSLICGYVEHAFTTLDPRVNNYCKDLLSSLGLTEVCHDPCIVLATRQDFEAIFESDETLAKLESDASDARDLLTLATACLVSTSGPGSALEDAFLVSLCRPKNDGDTVTSSLRKHLKSAPAYTLIDELVEDRPLRIGKSVPTTELPFELLRPKSNVIAGLVERFESDPAKYRNMRIAFMKSALLLADYGVRRAPKESSPGALNFAIAALAIGTDGSTCAEQFERLHYGFWRFWNESPAAKLISADRVTIRTFEDSLVAVLFFLRAGLFEMAFWGASARDVSERNNVCPYGIVSAIHLLRRGLLTAAFYALAFLAEDEIVHAPLVNVVRGVVDANLHAIKAMNTILGRLKTTIAHSMIWGGDAERTIANAKWLEKGGQMLSASPVTNAAMQNYFGEGLEFFAFEDFEVETPEKLTKHSRQDVWHGIGQAFG